MPLRLPSKILSIAMPLPHCLPASRSLLSSRRGRAPRAVRRGPPSDRLPSLSFLRKLYVLVTIPVSPYSPIRDAQALGVAHVSAERLRRARCAARLRSSGHRLRLCARERVLPRAGLHTSRLPRDELVGRRSRQRWRAAKAKGSSQLRVECVRTCVRACDATGSVALRALFHLPPCFELGMPRPLASLPFPFSLLVVPEPVQLPRQNKQPSCRPRQPTASSTLAPRGALYYIVACSRGMPYDARRGFISPQKSNIISHLSKPSPAAAFVARAGGCRVSGIVCSERSRTVLSVQAPARARTVTRAAGVDTAHFSRRAVAARRPRSVTTSTPVRGWGDDGRVHAIRHASALSGVRLGSVHIFISSVNRDWREGPRHTQRFLFSVHVQFRTRRHPHSRLDSCRTHARTQPL